MKRLFSLVLALCLAILAGIAHAQAAATASVDIGTIAITPDVTLRRMVIQSPAPKGTVLLLHGFPETLYAWKGIATALSSDYEVHAFDWPGFGLSSRPPVDRFSYAPRDYARVLKAYIDAARIDRSRLVIYATDIGALPVLLLALDEPDLAKAIVVGDFAPFDRPQYMNDTLRNLKSRPSSDAVHAAMNRNRDEILENTFRRGLPGAQQFELSEEFKQDMLRGWNHGELTTADAFYHYYAHFTEDERYFESNVGRLTAAVKVVWGEKDFYIQKEMGLELAGKARVPFEVLPGLGHYPHLQDPARAVDEIRAAFASR